MTIGISSKDMHMESKEEFMIAESRMVVIEEVSPLCRTERELGVTAMLHWTLGQDTRMHTSYSALWGGCVR